MAVSRAHPFGEQHLKVGEVDRSRSRSRPRHDARWVNQQSVFWYRLSHMVLSLLFRVWVRHLRALHVERVPAQGGAFLIANHSSGMDPFVLGVPVTHRMLRGPGREDLFTHAVFGYVMKKIGMFPLRLHVADAAAVRTMVEIYRSGKVVVVYPEGTRSVSGDLQPFSVDFARLMIRLKAVVVPAGIDGARELLPIKTRLPRRNTPVVVAYGYPLDLSRFYAGKITPEVAREAADVMQAAVAAMIQEAHAERVCMLRNLGRRA